MMMLQRNALTNHFWADIIIVGSNLGGVGGKVLFRQKLNKPQQHSHLANSHPSPSPNLLLSYFLGKKPRRIVRYLCVLATQVYADFVFLSVELLTISITLCATEIYSCCVNPLW